MYGNLLGTIISSLIFMFFQFSGLLFSSYLLKNKSNITKLVVGSSLGSILFSWLPVIFAFFVNYNSTAVYLSAITLLVAVLIFVFKKKLSFEKITLKKVDVKTLIVPIIVFTVFIALIFSGLEFKNGEVYSSQCTYGDMNMHLGFITSIANSTKFPVEYSIFPGEMLSYPFLSDSISSSFYVLGASLRFSYLAPMIFAILQIIFSVYEFLRIWLKSSLKVAIAMLLFFFNGGFGFIYFLDGIDDFTSIFTGFYTTPTNYNEENIRWSNIIVDMLVPQRATLFGWAVLFTALLLLLYAIRSRKKKFFVLTGIFAGSLPMIHTHSFLALFLVSFMWLFCELIEKNTYKNNFKWVSVCFIFIFTFMIILQFFVMNNRESDILLYIVVLVLIIVSLFSIYLFCINIKSFNVWLYYIIITLVLATPQLVFWTFSQASGDGFLRGYFDWANIDDNYLWFYIKNWGIVALAILPAVLNAKKTSLKIFSASLLIMFCAELVAFQPNVYDNNKLIYVSYFFCCGIVSSFIIDLLKKIKLKNIRILLCALVLFFSSISAILTIVREFVAEYKLYNSDYVNAVQFIEENTKKEDVFLTAQNHNNAISSLSGRNIVCGSGSFLYYHGIDYAYREEELKNMYEQPELSIELFEKYSVDYICIGDYEKSDYVIDENYFKNNFLLVYKSNSICIYQIK